MVARYHNLSLIVEGVLGCISDERSCGGSAGFGVGVAGLLVT
jgi:hypothetical protein